MIVFCLFIVAILFALGAYERTTKGYKAAIKLSCPGVLLPIIGNSYVVLRYTATYAFKELRKLAIKFGSGYCYYYLDCVFIQVLSAETCEKMLTSSNTKKGFFYTFLQPYIGTGVLTSFGAKWHERRRLISPSFHFSIIHQFIPIFKAHTNSLIDSLKTRQNVPINVNSMFSKYSLGLICETSMGITGIESTDYEKTLCDFGHLTQARVLSPYLHNDRIYRWLGYARKCTCLIKPMLDFTKDMIKKRRAILESREWKSVMMDEDEPDDGTQNRYLKKNQFSLLDALLFAQNQNGSISDEGIEEEVNTFVFTGHDTVTAAMTYTMLCIGEHPEVQQKLFEEIENIVKNEELTPRHLALCIYMDMVIKESLRLFPPVPLIFRTLEEDMDILGVTLPPGTNFHISIFDLHRDPKWFPDPDTFIPERFLPENTLNRHRFAYLPFSAGLRNCIGQKYAMMQMKTMIVKMIQKYRLESITKIRDLEFIVDMVLHTTRPVEINFISRNISL